MNKRKEETLKGGEICLQELENSLLRMQNKDFIPGVNVCIVAFSCFSCSSQIFIFILMSCLEQCKLLWKPLLSNVAYFVRDRDFALIVLEILDLTR